MCANVATLAGQLSPWPTKDHLARVLLSAGFRIYVGRYSVRVEDFECFSFEQYGGDLGDPVIDADAEIAEQLIRNAQRVSNALAGADIRHRFEIYDGNDQLAAYLHHRWPADYLVPV